MTSLQDQLRINPAEPTEDTPPRLVFCDLALLSHQDPARPYSFVWSASRVRQAMDMTGVRIAVNPSHSLVLYSSALGRDQYDGGNSLQDSWQRWWQATQLGCNTRLRIQQTLFGQQPAPVLQLGDSEAQETVTVAIFDGDFFAFAKSSPELWRGYLLTTIVPAVGFRLQATNDWSIRQPMADQPLAERLAAGHVRLLQTDPGPLAAPDVYCVTGVADDKLEFKAFQLPVIQRR